MITAVIIDDEALARDALENMVRLFCPNIQIVGQAFSVESGYNLIALLKPEVVFLDIQMPDGSGFDLLKRFSSIDFKFIIITAYQEFAVKAFRFSAIDFILKPIDPNELIVAVEKLQETIREEDINKKFQTLLENIQSDPLVPQKIILKTFDSVIVVDKSTIIRCESNNNYTMFYFTDKPKVLVSKTLKDFDDLLSSSGFFRTHQSHLVNLKFVSTYKRYPESSVIMTDGTNIPVSVRKRELLVGLLKTLQKRN
jgi:two-component system LytT family response regulator